MGQQTEQHSPALDGARTQKQSLGALEGSSTGSLGEEGAHDRGRRGKKREDAGKGRRSDAHSLHAECNGCGTRSARCVLAWALDGLDFLVSYCTSQEGGGSRPTGVTATALGVALGQPERLPVSPISAPCAVGSL